MGEVCVDVSMMSVDVSCVGEGERKTPSPPIGISQRIKNDARIKITPALSEAPSGVIDLLGDPEENEALGIKIREDKDKVRNQWIQDKFRALTARIPRLSASKLDEIKRSEGEKWRDLKEKMKEKLKVEREEGLRKREALWRAEKEEERREEGGESDKEEEEEEECGEESSEEEEEEDESDQDDEKENMDPRKPKNPFVEEEAEESGSEKRDSDEGEEEDDFSLQLIDTPCIDDEDSKKPSFPKETDNQKDDADDYAELPNSITPESDKKRADADRAGISRIESEPSLLNLSFPMEEDVGDEKLDSTEEKGKAGEEEDKTQVLNEEELGPSFSLRLDIPDSLSQMITPFSPHDHSQSQIFKIPETQSTSHKNVEKQSPRPSPNSAANEIPDDLLMLCSGQFVPEYSEKLKEAESGQEQNKNTNEIPQDILDLCSAAFPSVSNTNMADKETPGVNSPADTSEFLFDLDEGAMDGFPERGGSGGGGEEEEEEVVMRRPQKGRKRVLSESGDEEEGEGEEEEEAEKDEDDPPDDVEDEEEGEEGNESDDEVAVVRHLEEAETMPRKSNKKMVDKKGRLRKEFFEEEAELSGSDVGSDDEDLGSEADELEMEEGDLDEVPSEDELRNQVGKFYLKQQMDDDKKRLLLYQDAYIDEGDVNAENRMRRFRWRTQEGGGGEGEVGVEEGEEAVGEEAVDEDERMEQQWVEGRMEKLLWKQQLAEKKKSAEEESDGEEESSGLSSFFKLGKINVTSARSSLQTPDSSLLPMDESPVGAGGQSYVDLSMSFMSGRSISNVSTLSSQGTPILFRRDSLIHKDPSTLSNIAKSVAHGSRAFEMQANTHKSLYKQMPSKDAKNQKVKSQKATKKTASKKPRISNENSNSVFELIGGRN